MMDLITAEDLMAVQIGVNVREDGDDNINKTIARVY
jgi:hypothetical protein